MKCEEHRTIALISHASKILLRILLNRIQKTANEQIADVQMGFRKAVGTRDQIFILRVIMEKANEASVPYIWHLYKKAFDTVKHNKLWTVLKRMGLSGSTVDTLQSLYEGQQAAVRVHRRLQIGSRLAKEFVKGALSHLCHSTVTRPTVAAHCDQAYEQLFSSLQYC